MPNIVVAIVNETRDISDTEVKAVTSALQWQVTKHFAPAWGIAAELIQVERKRRPPPGSWWLTFLDENTEGTDLGYHDTTDEGMPMGKVFVRTALAGNYSWTVTASHELLEMLVDPWGGVNLFLHKADDTQSLFQYEVCDPCRDDDDAYRIGSILVSDFVLPSYFQPWLPVESRRYDFQNRLKGPVPELRPYGFIRTFDVIAGGPWTDLWGPSPDAAKRDAMQVRAGSRRARNLVSPDNWRRSNPEFA
jgi:hypothetical protein